MARIFTRPTPARHDAPCRGHCRSERRGESYSVSHIGPLSDARTKQADLFSILLEWLEDQLLYRADEVIMKLADNP
jgi:hypothetical protein